MDLASVRHTWETLGRLDPLWAVLTSRRFKYNRWEPEAFFETGRREIEAVLEYIDQLGIALVRGRALDFGCAVGRLSQSLGDYFQEVIGLDISAPMLERARIYNRHGDRCRYVLNTADHLHQFGDDTFDFVYSNITLQHIPPEHAKNYISEFFRVLRPGGVALFQIPASAAVTPRTLAGMYRRFRLTVFAPIKRWSNVLRGIPVIDSYPVPRATVEALIQAGGAELRDTVEDTAQIAPPYPTAGKLWQSFRYCAVKK